MQGLDLRWMYRSPISTGMALAKGDVWSRSARRKKEKNVQPEEPMRTDARARPAEDEIDESEDEDVQLGAKVLIRRSSSLQAQTPSKQTEITVRWLRGADSVLFESFCGMLKRQAAKAV